MDFVRSLAALPAFQSLFGPDWWNTMREDIAHNRFSPEAAILAFGIFAFFGLWIAAGLLIKIRSRRPSATPMTWIVRPGEIRALLDTALAQRSKVRVSFVRDDPGTRSTDASILAVDPARGVTLEMTSLVRANPNWVGKLVACDFRLRLDPRRNHLNFYNFVTPVRHIAKAGDDFVHMTVGWPSRLELEQKRGFLRVEPPQSFVLGLELWHEGAIRGSRGHFNDPATWGEPLLRVAAPTDAPAAHVRNISGGGLRLEVQGEAVRHHAHLFEPGNRFLMHLLLADPEAGHPMSCYLALRLQNIYGDAEAGGQKAMGFRFLSYGEPNGSPLGTLSWKTAVAGVAAVDDWVFKRHLEIYRSREE